MRSVVSLLGSVDRENEGTLLLLLMLSPDVLGFSRKLGWEV